MRQRLSSPLRPWKARAGLLLLAWLAAAAWGSVAQTHHNLQALAGLGVALPVALRLQTMAQDLAGFGPMYAAVLAAAWLPSLPVAAWLARRRPRWRVPLFAAAAGLGLLAALQAVNAVAPMPHLIDATRSPWGLGAMVMGAAFAGAAYGARSRRPG
jgi:hypothetical protein